MTVSAYQIDNVIKAYHKQQKTKLRGVDTALDPAKTWNADVVTLSGADEPGKDVFSKISYNILDILTKKQK